MSVYKSKRSTSAIQYVENARQLQVFTIKNCVKFPKRYTYDYGADNGSVG